MSAQEVETNKEFVEIQKYQWISAFYIKNKQLACGQYAQNNKNKWVENWLILWHDESASNYQLTHTAGGYERSGPMDTEEKCKHMIHELLSYT